MLSKCANPQCTVPFRYLHDGKLFRIELPAIGGHATASSSAGYDMKPLRRTEFFWLCTTCATQMTLVYAKDVGVTTRPLGVLQAAA